MNNLIETKPNEKIPDIAPGDTVKVNTKIVESGKERIQAFNGVVIRIRRGTNASFTVRHVAYGVGVERTFPFLSPMVESVELIRHGKVRRARLYYLRGLSGKAARIKEKRLDKRKLGVEIPETGAEQSEQPETMPPEATAQAAPVEQTQAQPQAKQEEPKEPAKEG